MKPRLRLPSNERLVQIGMACMSGLGSVLLTLGEHQTTLALVAILMAAGSLWLVDVKRWFALSDQMANVICLIVTAVQGWNFFFEEDSRLLVLANLLIYFQFILLFRRKTTHGYGLLAALSLAEVAVGSAINLGVLFGLLLFFYLVAALFTLGVFYLRRESAPAPGAAIDGAPINDGAAAGDSFAWSSGVEAGDAAAAKTLMRPLTLVAAVTFLLAVLLFLAVPRFGRSSWTQASGAMQRVTGYSETVTLGELGAVSLNPEAIMRVEFIEPSSGRHYNLAEPPLFRGAVLTYYAGGSWRQSGRRERYSPEVNRELSYPHGFERVDQKITIQPLHTNVLFSIFPAAKLDANNQILVDRRHEQFFRADSQRKHEFTFKLTTTGLRGGRQAPITPTGRPIDRRERQRLLQLPTAAPSDDPLAGLKRIAAAETASISPDDPVAVARRLETFLRERGGFRYTLDPVDRSRTLDPIEDFVVNNRAGHCEYFASALVLMLRSQGVPARMAVGFRGDEYNGLGAYYLVRQLHAHTWVEAYIPREQLPAAATQFGAGWQDGGWLRLDPTTADTAAERLAHQGWRWTPLNEFSDYTQFLWSSYVLGMDPERQRESVYEPLLSGVGEMAAFVFRRETRESVRRRLNAFFAQQWQNLREGRWFSWRGGLVAMAVSLFLVALVRLTRACWRFLRRRFSKDKQRRRRSLGKEYEFYHRLEALLARYGFERTAVQTQREFGLAAGGQFAESTFTRQAAHVPRRVAEAFYQVRFGGLPLDDAQARSLRDDVAQLQRALEQQRKQPARDDGRASTARNGES